jgi:hypothetical protein
MFKMPEKFLDVIFRYGNCHSDFSAKTCFKSNRTFGSKIPEMDEIKPSRRTEDLCCSWCPCVFESLWENQARKSLSRISTYLRFILIFNVDFSLDSSNGPHLPLTSYTATRVKRNTVNAMMRIKIPKKPCFCRCVLSISPRCNVFYSYKKGSKLFSKNKEKLFRIS